MFHYMFKVCALITYNMVYTLHVNHDVLHRHHYELSIRLDHQYELYHVVRDVETIINSVLYYVYGL